MIRWHQLLTIGLLLMLPAVRSTAPVSLRVFPQLCVHEKSATQCTLLISVEWWHDGSFERELCLINSTAQKNLHCNNAAQVTWKTELVLQENTVLQLRLAGDNTALAQQTLTMAELVTDLRPRRRYGWGIF